MKLLLITPYFKEKHRWMISGYKTAIELADAGIKVVVFTAGAIDKVYRTNENLKIYSFKDFFIPDPVNYGIIPFMFWKLWLVLKKEKPTHFLVCKYMFWTSLSVFFLKLLRKKIIITTDTFPGINWFSKSWYVNIILWFYTRTIGFLCLKLSNKVILYHEGLIDIAKKLKLNYQVIHNGIETNKFENIKTPNDLTKKNSEIFISYIGRIESVKGVDILLESAKSILNKHNNVKFLIVGDIQGKNDLVEKYSSPKIKFLGYRNDIPSILKITDIFVLASYSEGLPNALMEAMYMKCACISSNVGGVKTLIEDNINGLLFKKGNTEDLVTKLDILIKNHNLRKKLAIEANKKIIKSYLWENIVKEYKTIFEN